MSLLRLKPAFAAPQSTSAARTPHLPSSRGNAQRTWSKSGATTSQTPPEVATSLLLSPPPVGLIMNARAHRNQISSGCADTEHADVRAAAPETLRDLRAALREFERAGVETLVINGGDGTIREVITALDGWSNGQLPRISIVPSGKTNALAADLGIPVRWTVADALAAASRGRTVSRSPLRVTRSQGEGRAVQGFIFGAGAFVLATDLAQSVHRAGAFQSAAVALALAGALIQTLLAGSSNQWRRGEEILFSAPGAEQTDKRLYLLLASTLEHFPLGLTPLGQDLEQANALRIQAPPRNLLRCLLKLLTGTGSCRLADEGYARDRFVSAKVSLRTPFVLDGEQFPGGELTISQGTSINFVVP